MLLGKRAQSTAEYAIIIGVVIAAIMAVGAFLRGGIEAKVRTLTNQYISSGGEANAGALNTSVSNIMSSDYATTQATQEMVGMTAGQTGTELVTGGRTEGDARAAAGGTYGVHRAGSVDYFNQTTP